MNSPLDYQTRSWYNLFLIFDGNQLKNIFLILEFSYCFQIDLVLMKYFPQMNEYIHKRNNIINWNEQQILNEIKKLLKNGMFYSLINWLSVKIRLFLGRKRKPNGNKL